MNQFCYAIHQNYVADLLADQKWHIFDDNGIVRPPLHMSYGRDDCYEANIPLHNVNKDWLQNMYIPGKKLIQQVQENCPNAQVLVSIAKDDFALVHCLTFVMDDDEAVLFKLLAEVE